MNKQRITKKLENADIDLIKREQKTMPHRNVFENNEPQPDEEDVKAVGDGPHIMLPPLAEGNHYAFTKLPSGRTAVVVKQDEPETEEDRQRRDLYGRHKL